MLLVDSNIEIGKVNYVSRFRIRRVIEEVIGRIDEHGEVLPYRVHYFGSRQRGEGTKSSDLDLAIEFDETVPQGLADAIWIDDSDRWARQLSKILDAQVQLAIRGDQERDSDLEKGLRELSEVIYRNESYC